VTSRRCHVTGCRRRCARSCWNARKKRDASHARSKTSTAWRNRRRSCCCRSTRARWLTSRSTRTTSKTTKRKVGLPPHSNTHLPPPPALASSMLVHSPRCSPSSCVCLSVRLSVTSRCSTKTAKPRITQTTP